MSDRVIIPVTTHRGTLEVRRTLPGSLCPHRPAGPARDPPTAPPPTSAAAALRGPAPSRRRLRARLRAARWGPLSALRRGCHVSNGKPNLGLSGPRPQPNSPSAAAVVVRALWEGGRKLGGAGRGERRGRIHSCGARGMEELRGCRRSRAAWTAAGATVAV